MDKSHFNLKTLIEMHLKQPSHRVENLAVNFIYKHLHERYEVTMLHFELHEYYEPFWWTRSI